MGVYIGGTEMPMGGRILIVFPSGRVSEVSADATQEIFRETQAIPVPPHGDLVDRDEMRKTIKPWSPEDEIAGCTFDTVKKLMHTMISRAPVVIPAKEGE